MKADFDVQDLRRDSSSLTCLVIFFLHLNHIFYQEF